MHYEWIVQPLAGAARRSGLRSAVAVHVRDRRLLASRSSLGHHVLMSVFQPFRLRFPAWAEWIALFFMALAAPLIAALIQSVCVFVYLSTHGFYRSWIGRAYFYSGAEMPGLAVDILVSCGICGIITFSVLVQFRERALYRWLIWIGSIVVWTWFCFYSTEVCAIK